MFNDLFILFCRQTLSLNPSASLERRFCHPLLQNGDNSRQPSPVSTSMENTLVKNMAQFVQTREDPSWHVLFFSSQLN